MGTLISLQRKKIFQKGKRHSPVFLNAFQMASNYFSFHSYFNRVILSKGFSKTISKNYDDKGKKCSLV